MAEAVVHGKRRHARRTWSSGGRIRAAVEGKGVQLTIVKICVTFAVN